MGVTPEGVTPTKITALCRRRDTTVRGSEKQRNSVLLPERLLSLAPSAPVSRTGFSRVPSIRSPYPISGTPESVTPSAGLLRPLSCRYRLACLVVIWVSPKSMGLLYALDFRIASLETQKINKSADGILCMLLQNLSSSCGRAFLVRLHPFVCPLFHRLRPSSYNGSERERVSRTINHWEV